MRSTLTIVGEVAALRPQASLLAVTGSFQTDAWQLPANLDYVKLPTTAKRALFHGLRGDGPMRDLGYLREAVIESVVDAYEPQVVFVENAPAGLDREMVRALACLRAAEPRVSLVAGLGDIIDDAVSTVNWWRRDGVYDLLEDVYDHIVIYGDQSLYDPLIAYQFTPRMVDKSVFSGYLTRAEAPRPETEVREELGASASELVVVTAGGGADGADLFRVYLNALRETPLRDVVSFLVTGPLIDARQFADLQRQAAQTPKVTLIRFTHDIMSYFNAADLVVMKGGYNSTCDVLGLGKRALIVPRPRPQEQSVRARLLAERGYATVLPQTGLAPAQLAGAARDALNQPAPRIDLDFGGRQRVGQLLATLIDG